MQSPSPVISSSKKSSLRRREIYINSLTGSRAAIGHPTSEITVAARDSSLRSFNWLMEISVFFRPPKLTESLQRRQKEWKVCHSVLDILYLNEAPLLSSRSHNLEAAQDIRNAMMLELYILHVINNPDSSRADLPFRATLISTERNWADYKEMM